MKLVIGDGERVQSESVNGNASANSLRFWVDTDDHGDWSHETALLDTMTIDDVWSAGHVGLFRGSVSNAQSFDDFEAGIDGNADLDIADGGDEVVVDDDFATNVVSLTYDNNGKATDDGIHKHVYDSWNRKVKTTWRVKSTPSTLTTFSYDARGRLLQTAITNSGVENGSMDGGNTTVRALYTGGSVLEERNGSNQVVRHQLHASDGPVLVEVNGDPSIGDDVNADVTATGEGTESPADKRYFFAKGQGRKNVTALTEYTSGGGGNNGRIKERFVDSPGGPSRALAGDSGSGEMLSSSATSSVGVTPAGGWQGPMTNWIPGSPGWMCCVDNDGPTAAVHFGYGCNELGPQWEAVATPISQCRIAGSGTVDTTGTIDGPITPVDPGDPCDGPGEIKSPWGGCVGGIDTTSIWPPFGPIVVIPVCPAGTRAVNGSCRPYQYDCDFAQVWDPSAENGAGGCVPRTPYHWYGNCCGATVQCENGLGAPLPNDQIDAQCQAHDQCLADFGVSWNDTLAIPCHCAHVQQLKNMQIPPPNYSGAQDAVDGMITLFCTLIARNSPDNPGICSACN